MAASNLPRRDLKKIAEGFRQELVELSKFFRLEEGILGVTFFIPDFSGKLPIFAEKVGLPAPSTNKENYDLDRFHPFIIALGKNILNPDTWLLKEDVEASRDTHQDVWEPLKVLFDGEENVPKNIRIWRAWIVINQSSALYYYIPKVQQIQSNGWYAMTLLRSWAIKDFGKCIETLGELKEPTRNAFSKYFPSLEAV